MDAVDPQSTEYIQVKADQGHGKFKAADRESVVVSEGANAFNLDSGRV